MVKGEKGVCQVDKQERFLDYVCIYLYVGMLVGLYTLTEIVCYNAWMRQSSNDDPVEVNIISVYYLFSRDHVEK